MRNLDFSSWSGLFTTLLGLVLVSAVAVGIRLVFMQTIQRRRERQNRQINERLRTLMAAYKTLGGSFTGNLVVDPMHGRGLHRDQVLGAGAAEGGQAAESAVASALEETPTRPLSDAMAERRRRIRDTVEAALSDIVLLGTEEQVRLAVHAANEMVAGRRVEVKALVVSLRDFIREALDLAPIPADLRVPDQGPTRPSSTSGRSGAGGAGGASGGTARAGGAGGGGAGGAGGGAGMGMGLGMGVGGLGGAATHAARAGQDESDGATPP